MKKILIGLMLVSLVGPAAAREEHNYHRNYPHNNHNAGIGVGLGVLGLGILGATMFNQRQRMVDPCVIGYDRYNRPVYDQECFE